MSIDRKTIGIVTAAISYIRDTFGKEQVTIAKINAVSGLDVNEIFPEEILREILCTAFVVKENGEISVNFGELGIITAERIRTNTIVKILFERYWNHAVKCNNEYILEALLARKYVPVGIGVILLTPIYTSRHAKILLLLIEAGANVNALDYDYSTPLHTAIARSSAPPENIRILVEAGANVNARKRYGATPLHVAAQVHARESMSILIQAGANVNAQTELGDTPLHYAASSRNTTAVLALLRAGADANITNTSHKTALDVAEKRYTNDMIVILEEAMQTNGRGESK